MKLSCNYMLVIFGPTAVGKTDCALKIAQQLSAEIVNMDMGQLYTPLTIGTAKPDWRASEVPHHLFDVIDKPRNFSVMEYRDKLLKTLKKIWNNNKLPILVGGSGFYMKSIFFPPRIEQTIEDCVDEYFGPNVDLWQKLYAIDPDRSAHIDCHDTYRIRQALNIWLVTGKKPSLFVPIFDPPSPFFILYLTRDRQELYRHINARVQVMIDQGWIDEAVQLCSTKWKVFIKDKKIIGYNEIFTYLDSRRSQDDYEHMIINIKKRTRNYAKRQTTFWLMVKKELEDAINKRYKLQNIPRSEIAEANLTSVDIDLYIKKLLERLSQNLEYAKK